MLTIDGVRKSFGNLVAVDDLDLTVPAGSIHAFLGPNGAGKTTTLKMCTGLLRPDQGRIAIAGHDIVADGVEARRHIAYVPDEPYLYDRLSGREFLQFTAHIYGLSTTVFKQRFDEVVACFNLDGFLDQLAADYSHGMRQRVVLAAAFLHRPDLIIVDEPLVGLDPKHIRILLDRLRQHAADGGAVLMSTHTLSAVEDLADRLSVIRHGQQVFNGTLAELKADRGLEERFLSITEDGASPPAPNEADSSARW